MTILMKTSKWISPKLAMIASFSCAVHCLLSPLVVMFLPVLGHGFVSPFVEFGLLGASVVLGVLIIYMGYCKHKKQHIVFLYGLGVLFWGFHTVLEHIYHIHSDSILLILGSLFVVGSYWFNHKLLRCCDHH